MSTALTFMAWREILARVMEGFDCQENVSPDWLLNPATRRRLKLDLLYPEAGLAVRFVGLTARGQPRKSEWDLLEEEQRDQIRAEMCRQNDVELFLISSDHPDPRQLLNDLRTLLSRLSRMTAQGERSHLHKVNLMPRLAQARSRLDQIKARVRTPEDLALFAELWRDRETAALSAPLRPVAARPRRGKAKQTYESGQQIDHARFGVGVVLGVNGESSDPQITVRFEDGQERTFLASLVADKMSVH